MNPNEKVLELKLEGNSKFRCRQFREAITFYEQALEIVHENEKDVKELIQHKYIIYSNLSAVYLQIRDFDNAYDFSKKCVECNPDFEKGYYRMAHSLIGKGEIEKAKLLVSEHVKNPNIRRGLYSKIEGAEFPEKLYQMKIVELVYFPSLRTDDQEAPNLPVHYILNLAGFEGVSCFYLFEYDNQVFQFGGIHKGRRTNRLHRLDLKRREWVEVITTKNDCKPPPLSHHRLYMDLEEENLYVWGGIGDYERIPSHIYRLCMVELEWEILNGPNAPISRLMPSFGKIDDMLYVFGG